MVRVYSIATVDIQMLCNKKMLLSFRLFLLVPQCMVCLFWESSVFPYNGLPEGGPILFP